MGLSRGHTQKNFNVGIQAKKENWKFFLITYKWKVKPGKRKFCFKGPNKATFWTFARPNLVLQKKTCTFMAGAKNYKWIVSNKWTLSLHGGKISGRMKKEGSWVQNKRDHSKVGPDHVDSWVTLHPSLLVL